MPLVAVARVLALAAPVAWISSPLNMVQGFSQLLLFAALVIAAAIGFRGRRTRFVVLGVSHVAILIALGEAAQHFAWSPHALLVPAWAVTIPVALGFWARPRPTDANNIQVRDADYRKFWDQVGKEFPDLGGAASTAYYRANEQRLIDRHLPALAGRRVLKTDLWDEARNTRILQWMAQRGALVAGIDISGPVIQLARREFGEARLLAAGADVRALPFADGTFDAIYSMGTVEHFPETDAAIAECFRVLKPGGRVLMGVPNRRDPFLRPLMVAILYRIGLYDYGFEKSYSRPVLRKMLERAGFTVVGDDAILFIPGWLRMLDLLCHTRAPLFSPLTGAAVRVFQWIDHRVPAVRRHGYLLVAVGDRPAASGRTSRDS